MLCTTPNSAKRIALAGSVVPASMWHRFADEQTSRYGIRWRS